VSGANSLAFTGVPDPRRWYMLREIAMRHLKVIVLHILLLSNPSLGVGDSSLNFVGTGYASGGTYLNPEQRSICIQRCC
jgi:hypothetical protein